MKSSQKLKANLWKLRGERRLKALLRPWIAEISTTYRIGDTSSKQGLPFFTLQILKQFQYMTVNDMAGFDVREYKVNDNELLEIINRQISELVSEAQGAHNPSSVRSIVRTSDNWIRRTTELAIANNWTNRDATIALSNYLRGQAIIISSTESQWIVEGTRQFIVKAVKDPLRNSIRTIADMFRNNQTSEARKLAKEVARLARLPLSRSQGSIVGQVAESQARLIGPDAQGRALASIERQAESLGKSVKEWNAIYVRTRSAHLEADGQQVDVDVPYIVGGEMLNFPGDGSLGASLWNLINCQCYNEFL